MGTIIIKAKSRERAIADFKENFRKQVFLGASKISCPDNKGIKSYKISYAKRIR